MSYVNAEDVLPQSLIEEIQKYVDGGLLYVPRKETKAFSWGEKSGARDRMAKRNQEIVSRYYQGETISNLSEVYFLSEKRIRGIICEYESSQKKQTEDLKRVLRVKKRGFQKSPQKNHGGLTNE